LTPTAHLLLSSFFSPHTPPPQFYTLSLHDALPISSQPQTHGAVVGQSRRRGPRRVVGEGALQKEVEQPQVLLQGGAVRGGGVLDAVDLLLQAALPVREGLLDRLGVLQEPRADGVVRDDLRELDEY